MNRVTAILRDLVTIPSVSSASNEPVIEYALMYLNEADWQIHFYRYEDQAGTPKVNLVAVSRSASGSDVELALMCHTDTVPYDAAWEDAVAPVQREGNLYGRGSCDVKGFLACIFAGVQQIDVASLVRPLAIVLTSDEEIGCVGAKLLVGEKAFRSRHTLVGEPTGLRPVRAGKGYALAEIVVKGKEAHSAFPQKGRSAIYDAARVITAIERIAADVALDVDPGFVPPYTTVNCGLVQGGTAKNIVPGECRITVEWRPIPGQDPRRVANLMARELSNVNAELDVKRIDPGFGPGETEELAIYLEKLTGRSSTTAAFGTEAAHLKAISSETVVFGPGDMTTAHRTGEFVPVAELEECVEHIKATVRRFCG